MKNKILYAEKAAEKSRDSKSLIVYLVLLPLAILILLLLIALIIFTEINQSSKAAGESSYTSVSESAASHETEDNEKLLVLASAASPLDEDYKPNLESYNGISCDSAIIDELSSLIAAAKQDGVTITATGGYISAEEQDKLFEAEAQCLMQEKDYSQVKAETEAEKSVPKGNESDRQTGLSVTLEADDSYAWLEANAYKYGFIQRYPESGESETGIKADLSLYRYVGEENARKIRILGMCLDEYVSYVNSR